MSESEAKKRGREWGKAIKAIREIAAAYTADFQAGYDEVMNEQALGPRSRVISRVWDERERQDEKYGVEHDDAHDNATWITILRTRFDKISDQKLFGEAPDDESIVQLAAVAVAWLERRERIGNAAQD